MKKKIVHIATTDAADEFGHAVYTVTEGNSQIEHRGIDVVADPSVLGKGARSVWSGPEDAVEFEGNVIIENGTPRYIY